MADFDVSVRSAALPEAHTEWRRHAGVVSWGAVFAGAVAAAAFGLILLTLGAGLGLAALSPWHAAGVSAAAFGFAAIVWVCVTQILTSGLGGYLAGRLRHRWLEVDIDEVYFRDTAHGFLTWAVATLATAALVAAMLPAAGRAGAQAVAKATPFAPIVDRGDANAAANRWPIGYYVDSLFRRPAASQQPISSTAQPSAAPATASTAAPNTAPNPATAAASAPATNAGANTAAGTVVSPVATPTLAVTATAAEPSPATAEPPASGAPPKPEVTRIFLNSLATDDPLSTVDTRYVATLVGQYTGIAPDVAQSRVAATYTQLQHKVAALKEAARAESDRARRGSVDASLWLFVSLLMGAFSASFMAVFGGRMRDV